jgi:hypothetical protein
MERSGIAVRCGALFGIELYQAFSGARQMPHFQ